MKKFLFIIFAILITTASNAQFLLIKGQSGPTSFPFGKGPYGTIGGITQTNGNVVVGNGQTLTLTAGTVYDFKSLTIQNGGVVNITGHGIVLLGSVGNIVIDGSITSSLADKDYTVLGCTRSFSITEPQGTTSYSYAYDFSVITYSNPSAGMGGDGGTAFNGNQGAYASGGYGGYSYSGNSCGLGSGGGGGAGLDSGPAGCPPCPPGQYCKLCNSEKYGQYTGGAGATSDDANGNNYNGANETLDNGGTAFNGYGGLGGGAVGGVAGIGSYTYGGSGGGGGFHGLSASSLVIKSRGSVTGAGTINLSGGAGFNGGGGGNASAYYYGSGGGGGGGGGGTGGTGGNLSIYYKTGAAFPTSKINTSGGAAGAGGLGGPGMTKQGAGYAGNDGMAGQTGRSGLKTIITW